VKDRACLALGAVIAALLLARPAAHGVSLPGTLAFWLFVAAVVVVPGAVLCRRWGPARERGLRWLGQGATVGLAVHGVASFAGLAVGLPWIGEAGPVALAVAALLVRRSAPADAPEAPPSAGGDGAWRVLLLALLAIAVLVQPLVSSVEFLEPVPHDLLFHAGNAAEVRHRWPLEDPRVAGLPLRYHVFAYALPAAFSRWTGVPVVDSTLALAPLLWIALLVLQIDHLAGALFGDRRVGVLAAALVCFHSDPARLLGLPAWAFNSYLATGVYSSPTTIVGFLVLAALGAWIPPLLAGPAPPRAPGWILLAVLAAAGAATKPTAPASAIGGLAFLAAWAWLRRHPAVSKRSAALALWLLAASLPPLLMASVSSRASQGFRWSPGAVVWESGFAQLMERVILGGPASSWAAQALARVITAPLWAVGYLGLAAFGFAAYAGLRAPGWSAGRVWAGGVILTGAALALTLHALGYSQLFFLYNGQLLLALFGGAGLWAVLQNRDRSRALRLLLALLAVCALPLLEQAGRQVALAGQADWRSLHRPLPPLARDYAAGLAWLRSHAARSVVFADNPSEILSAFGECRTYYEHGRYTLLGHLELRRGNLEPYPERVELQRRFLFQPGGEVAAAVRAQIPGATVRVVADAVQSESVAGRVVVSIGAVPDRSLLPPRLFEREFVSRTMHVYRLKAAPGEPSP
jgi:hypothetical protein